MPADAVWQGRIATGLDPRAKRLNDSLPVDSRLWPEELRLSRAWGSAIAECGVLDATELRELLIACDALEAQLAAGTATLEGEDVHSGVEAALESRCGDAARRLHTGRSRNDQVATLLRMRVMSMCEDTVEAIQALERALVAQARASGTIAVAAYTHLQPAQPVLLAHLWLAHLAAFERDEERFLTAREAADRMPLGSGAVAGSPLRVDRATLAQTLGFSRLAENSVDAVGDRDFAVEYLQAAALLGVHLSRLGEDLVLWCSPAFGWYTPGDGFSTGSSLLPQKRNPDLFELARGKSARLIANAQCLATLLKGLPSAYQKDLQEDKVTVFDSGDTLEALLAPLPDAITTLTARPARMRATLTPDLLAVELADAMVERGVPFRDAHGAVGRLWAAAEQQGVEPAALPLGERLALSPHFTDPMLASLSVESALARRSHSPGAGPESVAAQLKRAEARLGLGVGDPEGPGAGSELQQDATPGLPFEGVPELAPASSATSKCMRIRRARLDDVTAIAGLMAGYVTQGILLPRPVSELFQCVREFVVAEDGTEIVGCAALRLLWGDLGEVRSLAVRGDQHGRGIGQQLVTAVLDEARAIGLPRVIALTREVPFFQRVGFSVASREHMPRKVWTDCVRCPKRHACDEVAVVLDLIPGASEAAERAGRSYVLPIPQMVDLPILSQPVVS
ncbi:MAG: argininosuccinate lyase [Candidatus Eisenbacteria bacterium]|uniref:Argininosuccinate lyase n=1 Tax=Eiseniibacteriota bacterium TaxID=2212470 RepID=A0A849SL91_UNCEI|nr:argininosuccinate lyase [Candidatus Eisenbacteria bacterium]